MDIQNFLKGVGLLVGAFNPSLGGSIVSVGDIVNSFGDIDDKDLESVKGLGYVSKGLRDLVDGDNFDKDKILEYIKIIDAISLILEKNYKLIK